MSKVESTTKDDAKRRIAAIVKRIKEGLAEVKRGIAGVIATGEALIEARELVEHGQWLPWLKEHFDLSPRSAQRFMRLARHKEALLAKCDSAVAFETITAALDALVPVTVQVIKETTEPRRINVEMEQVSVPLMSPEAAAYYAEQHERVSVPLMSPEAAAHYAEQKQPVTRDERPSEPTTNVLERDHAPSDRDGLLRQLMARLLFLAQEYGPQAMTAEHIHELEWETEDLMMARDVARAIAERLDEAVSARQH